MILSAMAVRKKVANYSSEYQAILDRATTLGYTHPSTGQKTKQNTLVSALKTAGIWSKLDAFYVFANDGGADFATINWKSPSANQATRVNSPSWATNVGFTGNGTSSYIDTNYIQSAETSPNFLTNSASLGAYSVTDAAGSNSFLIASSGSNRLLMNPRNPSDIFSLRLNSSTVTTYSNSNSIGFFSGNRSDASNETGFKNGVSYGAFSSASSGADLVLSVLCLKGGAFYSTRTIGCAFIGGSLTDAEHASFSSAYLSYTGSL